MSIEARIAAVLGDAHDGRCEREFISWPHRLSPCGCAARSASLVVAELGLTQTTEWANWGDEDHTWVRPEGSEHWARSNAARHPSAGLLQREVYSGSSPWCASPSSPEGESNE